MGSVAGLGGMGAGIGAILFTQATGFVVDHFSYTPMLIAAGLLPLLGTGLLFALGGRVQRIGQRHDQRNDQRIAHRVD